MESENRDLNIEKVLAANNRIAQSCLKGKLAEARREYEEAKEFIKCNADEQPELQYFLSPNSLIRAYLMEGKLQEALELFSEVNKDLAERAKDQELQEKALALSEANDVWSLFEELSRFATKETDEPFYGATLEVQAATCYSAIVGDHWRSLYEELKFGGRQGYKEPQPRLGKGGRSTALIYTYSTMNPDEAFPLFQAAYKQLAEIYQDQELQQSCLAFREANDVWKRHSEVIKLAEKYRNKELRQQFLYMISFCYGESILDYSKVGKVDEAQAVYESLKHVVEMHVEGREDDRLLFAQAKGAANLIYTFVTANRPDEARMMYEELSKLASEISLPKVLVWQANRASDVLYAYATANRPDEARMMYEELSKLASEDYPGEPQLPTQLRTWQADGAVSLVYAYCKTRRYADAKEIFQELEELRSCDNNVGVTIGKKKINGVPVMDWLRQLLQQGSTL